MFLSKVETQLVDPVSFLDSRRQNNEKIRRHATQWSHLETKFDMKKARIRMKKSNLKQLKKEDNYLYVTNNYMATAYAGAKMVLSFRQFGNFTQHMESRGVDMGTRCHSEWIASSMTKLIYETMNTIMLDNLRHNESPLSLIVDGGSDSASNSYTTVFFQYVDGQNQVKVLFYRAIMLESHEGTAEGQTQKLLDTFRDDRILEMVRSNLVAYVSDSANVLMGDLSGVGVRLQSALGLNNLIRHKCLPHRIESAVKKAKLRGPDNPFPNFEAIEEDYNELGYFYTAPKRRSNLRTYVGKMNPPRKEFFLTSVHTIRWTDSHFLQTQKFITKHSELTGHLKELSKDRRIFDPDTRSKALTHYNKLTNKNMLMSLATMLDFQEIIKVQSKIFQTTGSSIIGQSRRIESLLHNMNEVKMNGGGRWTRYLLGSSTCQQVELSEEREPDGSRLTFIEGRTIGHPGDCLTLEQFERERVVFNGGLLTGRVIRGKGYQHLSTFKDAFVKKLIKEVKSYLGDEELQRHLKVMDHRLWPENVYNPQQHKLPVNYLGHRPKPDFFNPQLRRQHMDAIAYLANQVNMGDKYYEIEEAWLKLMIKLYSEKTFMCAVRKDKVAPWEMWQSLLMQIKDLDEDLRRFIKSILAIPFSAAIVERGYSVMKHIRGKLRWRLSPETTNGLLMISLNGVPIAEFNVQKYTMLWLRQGHLRCDDLSVSGQPHHPTTPEPWAPSPSARKPEEIEEAEEVGPNDGTQEEFLPEAQVLGNDHEDPNQNQNDYSHFGTQGADPDVDTQEIVPPAAQDKVSNSETQGNDPLSGSHQNDHSYFRTQQESQNVGNQPQNKWEAVLEGARQRAKPQNKWKTLLEGFQQARRGETSFTASQPTQPTLRDKAQATNRRRTLPVVEPPIEEVQDCSNDHGVGSVYSFGLTPDDLDPGPNTVGHCGDSGTPRKRMRIEIDEAIQCRFKTIEFAAEKKELDRRRGEVAGMTKTIVAKWPVKQLSWWVYIYAIFHILLLLFQRVDELELRFDAKIAIPTCQLFGIAVKVCKKQWI